MTLHIFTARDQPATKLRFWLAGKMRTFKYPPRSLVWCRCCKRKRIAANCVAQVYYDMTNYRCATGKGCKR